MGQPMGHPMGQPGGPVPIVQGVAVGGCPPMAQPYGMTPGGAPIVIGAATGGMGLPHIVVEQLPIDEMIVMRYRFSLMCFAVIDAISTILDAGRSVSSYSYSDEPGEPNLLDSWAVRMLRITFIIGPICGLVGARRLARPLVSVYLGFCLVKTSYYVFDAIYRMLIWLILIALVQMWVTKIVFTFWRALGKLSQQRIQEILNPGTGSPYSGAPVRMAYF